eukprot:TRINITY_DN15806_c0_g2_i1.p1 TRINITY_DN15806_c0_g2~~TRINITY_DN15806_c0_g2_i1.p1  ORF type:complete len:161 (+),score=26.40 TRINITY_DN15806_c0_g2_i1:3-485(+)
MHDWWMLDCSMNVPGRVQLGCDQVVQRYDHSICVGKEPGSGFLFGGLDESGQPSASLFAIEVFQEQARAELVVCANSCRARHGHSAVVLGDQLFVLGGVGSSILPSAEMACLLDLGSKVWSILDCGAGSVERFCLNHQAVVRGHGEQTVRTGAGRWVGGE